MFLFFLVLNTARGSLWQRISSMREERGGENNFRLDLTKLIDIEMNRMNLTVIHKERVYGEYLLFYFQFCFTAMKINNSTVKIMTVYDNRKNKKS